MEGLEDVYELVAEAVFEGHPIDVDPARNQDDFFVFDVDALQRADALWKREDLWLTERRSCVPAAFAFVDHGRVETFFDRCPDRKCRGEVVAVNHEVGTVADADFIDLGEQVIGRVAGSHVGESGFDTHPNEGHQVAVLPDGVLRKLRVAEPSTGFRVWLGRMRRGHVHRHIDVVAVGGKGTFEDRWVESRVAGVENHVGSAFTGERGDRVLA